MRRSIFFIILCLPAMGQAQDEHFNTLDCNCKIYKSYLNNRIDQWPNQISEMEKRFTATNTDYCLFQLAFAHFGYTGYLFNTGRNTEVLQQIKKTEKYVQLLVNRKAYLSRTEALKGSLIALRIGLNPSTALIYGRTSIMHIHKAIAIDSACPYGWAEHGVFVFHMPKIMGGSFKEAAGYFEKAIRLFERDKSQLTCNWYYLNIHLWLIKSYRLAGMEKAAETIIRKIQKIEPEFNPDFSVD